MSGREKSPADQPRKESERDLGVYIGLGIAFGFMLGLMLGNPASGIALGTVFAVIALGLDREAKVNRNKRGE